jgi:hypothetical protein
MVALKDSHDRLRRVLREPHHFEPESIPDIKPETFAHLPPDKRRAERPEGLLPGLVLEGDCPENDCRLYLNIFNMCREVDVAINA